MKCDGFTDPGSVSADGSKPRPGAEAEAASSSFVRCPHETPSPPESRRRRREESLTSFGLQVGEGETPHAVSSGLPALAAAQVERQEVGGCGGSRSARLYASLVFRSLLTLGAAVNGGEVSVGAARVGDAPPHRVYSHLLEPGEHPDYARRAVKPPSWATFKQRTQFTCLRGFGMKDDQITGYAEELERFTRTHELGDVIWPSYPILFAKNLGDLADEIRRRDLYLFDIWGYVPGSGPGGELERF